MRASLGLDVVTEKARICGLATLLAERATARKANGVNLLAMMGVVVFNCSRIEGRLGAVEKESMSSRGLEKLLSGPLLRRSLT